MITILNYLEADRRTAIADEALVAGDVVKVVVDGANGQRHVTKLGDTDDALAVKGNVGVVYKVRGREDSVISSTASSDLGSRLENTIASGELCVLVREGYIEYTADELDDSLNPDTAGTLPDVGDTLGVAGSRPASVAAATSAGITTPVIFRVDQVNGTKVALQIVL